MRLTYADHWQIHHRRSTRLKERDYAADGMYFVTICTAGREHLLGKIVDGEMVLNKYGIIANECWRKLPDHFSFIEIDAFVVMPNHVHGILRFHSSDESHDRNVAPRGNVGARHSVPLQYRAEIPRRFGEGIPRALSSVIGSFKSAVTKRINTRRNTPTEKFWQWNYHEHIVRKGELDRIRKYIVNNPKNWHQDL